MNNHKQTRIASQSKKKPAKHGGKKSSAPHARIAVTAGNRAVGKWFAKLVALQERLCAPNGCPWDREQTHASLRKYLIEETYEVLDAMDSGDQLEFASELGDLLLQIVFHSVLAESAGKFDISQVIEAIFTKMVRRHPHVFGDAEAATSGAVLKKWEELKAQERAAKRGARPEKEAPSFESLLSAVPRSLPGVLEAYQLTRRASHIGFDWESLQGIFDKIDEEKRELSDLVEPSMSREQIAAFVSPGKSANNAVCAEEEVGDFLFAAVNVARFLGVDPEIALKKANNKFKARFQWMERKAAANQGTLADVPRDQMEELWNEAKKHHFDA